MPELPEAETIARTLAPRLEGRRIVQAQFLAARVQRGALPPLAGRIIRKVRRHGKFILLDFEEGFLAVHLGMTGKLLLGIEPGPHTRAVLLLNEGSLVFDDVRQFGFFRWLDRLPESLGPDPLELRFEELCQLLHGRRGAVKPLLLNQTFLRGIGNIYTDEILFRARIHPLSPAARLGRKRIHLLYEAVREVLTRAIAEGGSSISDYVDANGRKGSFQFFHQVYRKTGRPCPLCGTAIRRIVVAQRGTHYCPRCQRY